MATIGYRGRLFIYSFICPVVYLPVYLLRLLTACCELGIFLLLFLLDWGFFGRSFVLFLPSLLFPAFPPTLLKLFCLPRSFQTPPVREGGRRGRNTSLPAGGGGPAQLRAPTERRCRDRSGSWRGEPCAAGRAEGHTGAGKGCNLAVSGEGKELPLSLPAQDLADTTVADPQLPGNVTGSHPLVSQLHYPLSHHVR